MEKGTKIYIKNNCKCPTLRGQKRVVTMTHGTDMIFASKENGHDERLFYISETEMLNRNLDFRRKK